MEAKDRLLPEKKKRSSIQNDLEEDRSVCLGKLNHK